MSFRRFIPLFVLIALALAPFGRMSAAEAMTGSHHAATSEHCEGQRSTGEERSTPMTINCMIACAAMTPTAAAMAVAPPPPSMLAATAAALPDLAGIRPEAEPPPPRLA